MKWFRASLLAYFSTVLCLAAAWAGPPFQTDDPQPIEYKNYEFYTFASADGTPVEMDTAGPAAEFNWGCPSPKLHPNEKSCDPPARAAGQNYVTLGRALERLGLRADG